MKLALGMMLHQGEAPYLPLHLYPIAQQFDGLVFALDPTEDTQAEREALRDYSLTPRYVEERQFNNNWSEYFNHIIERAEQLGFDAILRLDPDETLFPADIQAVRELLETYCILCFSRINYWRDRMHYTPGIFPDWQARAWQLNKGIRLGGKHHEGIGWLNYGMFEGDAIADTPRQVLRVPSITIHHYGNVGRERILERDLHYLNVAREQAGHPSLTERPADREFPTRHSIPYRGPQPLDPQIIGATAPWEE